VEARDYLRPPFSTYDVVVYFGCGLFSIPFLNRYIVGPMELGWPRYAVPTGNDIADSIVSFLALAFSIYIIGHVIAYMASQIVEKWSDAIFGKISTVMISIADHKPGLRNKRIRARIFENVSRLGQKKTIVATGSRSVPHLSQIPLYLLMLFFGVFGFYNTRLSEKVVAKLQNEYSSIGIADIHVSEHDPWFKPLEYYVMNRVPDAIPRMYNYLVISGLFRSVSLIFLMSSAAIAIHSIVRVSCGEWIIEPAFGQTNAIYYFYEYAALSVLYYFSLASYLKFQRRYAEEAIYAYIFR
jgi:hypothetical protein